MPRNRLAKRGFGIGFSVKRSGHRMRLVIIISTLLLANMCTTQVHSALHSCFPFQISDQIEGLYLEYLLSSIIIVLWNYTINDGLIQSVPGKVLHEDEEGHAVKSEILIRLEFLDWVDSDDARVLIRYNGNTSLGYNWNHSQLVYYSMKSGRCVIESGTLVGQTGILRLFLGEWDDGESIISAIADFNATAELVDDEYQGIVMEEQQEGLQYACKFLHIVDGNVTHHRMYDKDARVLLRANGGVADLVLLGLGNISYAVGDISLVDTNIDLGPPIARPSTGPSNVVGFAALGAFGVLYIALYKTQRSGGTSKKPHKAQHKRKSRKTCKVLSSGYCLFEQSPSDTEL